MPDDFARPVAELFAPQLGDTSPTLAPTGGRAFSLDPSSYVPTGARNLTNTAYPVCTPSANSATAVGKLLLNAFYLNGSFPVSTVKHIVNNASGATYDIGIYDSTFRLLWHLGSTVDAGGGPGSAWRTANIFSGSPDNLTLGAGLYYFAALVSNGTGTTAFIQGDNTKLFGVGYQSTAATFTTPLPDSILLSALTDVSLSATARVPHFVLQSA